MRKPHPIRPTNPYPIRPTNPYPIRPTNPYPIRPTNPYPIRPTNPHPIRLRAIGHPDPADLVRTDQHLVDPVWKLELRELRKPELP
jgi:hypothetical protein